MHPNEHLSDYLARLADEELVTRLRSVDLTDYASEMMRRELEQRGIDVVYALAHPAPPFHQSENRVGLYIKRLRPIFRRLIRFPLRTLLGIEPPLVVIFVGGGLVYATYRLVIYGLSHITLSLKNHPLAVPLSYVEIALFVLVQVWFSVSLWRCSRRIDFMLLRLVVKFLSLLFIFPIVFGTSGLVHVVDQYLSR